jgi:hypothetical protein
MRFKPERERERRAKKVEPITHNTQIIFKHVNYITCSIYS